MTPHENSPQVPTGGEREDLVTALAVHRAFLLHTAQDLTEEQARQRSTVSELTISSLLKHVADTEQQWFAFAERGASAFAGQGVYESDVDWEAVATEAEGNDGDWSGSEWEDTRFVVSEEETLPVLRARVAEVAATTEAFLRTADLDAVQALPEAPWFERGARWSVRRVALHVLAETSQHAGHADIIREAIDGQRTMG